MPESKFIQLPDMLAVLAHDGDYSYIDRVANSQSKPLVLHYLREALRDFNALKRSPPNDMKPDAKDLLWSIKTDFLEYELDQIKASEDPKVLREIVSYICSKALARASKFIEKGRGGGVSSGKEEGAAS
jgi:hypothetical protein